MVDSLPALHNVHYHPGEAQVVLGEQRADGNWLDQVIHEQQPLGILQAALRQVPTSAPFHQSATLQPEGRPILESTGFFSRLRELKSRNRYKCGWTSINTVCLKFINVRGKCAPWTNIKVKHRHLYLGLILQQYVFIIVFKQTPWSASRLSEDPSKMRSPVSSSIYLFVQLPENWELGSVWSARQCGGSPGSGRVRWRSWWWSSDWRHRQQKLTYCFYRTRETKAEWKWRLDYNLSGQQTQLIKDMYSFIFISRGASLLFSISIYSICPSWPKGELKCLAKGQNILPNQGAWKPIIVFIKIKMEIYNSSKIYMKNAKIQFEYAVFPVLVWEV